MKDLRHKEMGIVFVGCGGTFWTSSPYFSYLLQEIRPASVYAIDPDKLTEENLERQWCNYSDRNVGVAKATCAMREIALQDRTTCGVYGVAVKKFQEWMNDVDAQEDLEDKPVLVIVNVDNDEARLAVREWCQQRFRQTIMVMSGCDMNYGQVYYGVYQGAGGLPAKHDWFDLHTDVGKRAEPIQRDGVGCGAQSTLSNFMTGALFAPAIEEAVQWFRDEWTVKTVGEWYWRRFEDGKLKAWTQYALPSGLEVEDAT